MNETFWKRFPPIRGFDCLKMKNDIQARIYEDIKDMTPAQRLEYYRRGAGEFRSAHARGRMLAVHEESPAYGSKPDGRKKA